MRLHTVGVNFLRSRFQFLFLSFNFYSDSASFLVNDPRIYSCRFLERAVSGRLILETR